ncbi:hypothetical protein F4860DRAFT_514432 [Xylaria cubensis]|nr:hypothetical protein F4860DRAFT_514432 [Xylaria cubensis]
MKAAFLTFFAIGGFIASSIANPIAVSGSVAKRQDDGLADLGASLDTLLGQIQEQTAIISEYLPNRLTTFGAQRVFEADGYIPDSTLDSLSDTVTDSDATVTADSIAPQLQAITDLLTAADSALVVKRALVEARFGKPDLFKTVSFILYELLFTVKVILFKLGLAKVVIFLTPLVLALKGLLFKLDLVVGGLLFAVGALANELLKAVGVALIAL